MLNYLPELEDVQSRSGISQSLSCYVLTFSIENLVCAIPSEILLLCVAGLWAAKLWDLWTAY